MKSPAWLLQAPLEGSLLGFEGFAELVTHSWEERNSPFQGSRLGPPLKPEGRGLRGFNASAKGKRGR